MSECCSTCLLGHRVLALAWTASGLVSEAFRRVHVIPQSELIETNSCFEPDGYDTRGGGAGGKKKRGKWLGWLHTREKAIQTFIGQGLSCVRFWLCCVRAGFSFPHAVGWHMIEFSPREKKNQLRASRSDMYRISVTPQSKLFTSSSLESLPVPRPSSKPGGPSFP